METTTNFTFETALGAWENKESSEGFTKLDPLQDGISAIELIRVSGTDLDIVNAARVSFGKITRELSLKDEKLIDFLITHNHTSPFEHNQLSYRIKAPIYVARQWMRHRMNSYNEISYRYVKCGVEFYKPAFWRGQSKANRQVSEGLFENAELLNSYTKALEKSYAVYEELLEAGVARELARGVLPLCTYTEFIFTCNLHSLMNFFKLRAGKDAQNEIQAYSQGLLLLAEPYFPYALQAFKRKMGLIDDK